MSHLPKSSLNLVEIPFVDSPAEGRDGMDQDASDQKYLIRLTPRPVLHVPQLQEVAGHLAGLVQVLDRIAEVIAPKPDQDQQPGQETEQKRSRARARSGRRGRDREGMARQPSGLSLPGEVSTAEAAEILGVSKDTVLAYREKGLLPSRNLAPPGRSKPMYLFPLEAVIGLRTTYQTEEPAPDVPRDPPRRQAKGRRQFKHLIVGDE